MNKPAAYIHIPKTGGTYLGQLETPGSQRQFVVSPFIHLGHRYVVDNPSVLNPIYEGHDEKGTKIVIGLLHMLQYKVFSIVRNPFSWLVSYYDHAAGLTEKYRNTEHYDYNVASKGFDYFLKTITNRVSPWPCRKFLFFQLFCNNGQFLPDYICKMETLDSDLKEFAEQNGLSYSKKMKQRMGTHGDYRTYYNDSLVDLVWKTWGRELMLFYRDVEGAWCDEIAEGNHLYRNIHPDDKKRIKYFWDDDRLVVDGKETQWGVFRERTV